MIYGVSETLLGDIANNDKVQMGNGTLVGEKQKVGVVDDGNAEMHHDLESEEALFKHT